MCVILVGPVAALSMVVHAVSAARSSGVALVAVSGQAQRWALAPSDEPCERSRAFLRGGKTEVDSCIDP